MHTAAEIAPIAPSPVPVRGKGFAIRAAAFLVDFVAQVILFYAAQCGALVMLLVPMVIIQLVIGREIGVDEKEAATGLWVVAILLQVLYFAFFEWLYGASPGKVLLRMRVVRLDGSPLSFRKALARSLWRLLDGIGFGLVAWASMKRPLYQRVGDQQTGTVVVSSKDPIIRKSFSKWNFLLALGFSFGVAIVGSCLCGICVMRLK